MGLVSDNIPNLIGGVSQQPAPIRRSNQFEAQDNVYGTVVDGLGKRPPTFHVAKLLDIPLPTSSFLHTINRDASERYQVVITDEDLQVFDLATGEEKTVSFPDGTGYLSSASPKDTFRALTVADYTFIVNRDRVAGLTAEELSPARNPEALVNVKLGNYGRTYKITVQSTTPSDGPFTATYTVPNGSDASHTASVATDAIATQLYNDLVAARNSGTGWNFTRYASTIHINHDDGRDFSVQIEDGFNGNAMYLAKDRVQRFSDLPTTGPDGFTVEIVGDSGVEFDNYWVKLTKKSATDSNGQWVETVKPGITWELAPDTMPHQLVRNEDGTFTFAAADWAKRLMGDTVTNEEPSFVGQKIKDVFFHRNRLGLIAGENVIFSRAGEFFNFWRRTVTALLDDDPVDTTVPSTTNATLYNALPFNKTLTLFSAQTQYELSADKLLTPKTAGIEATTEFQVSTRAKPVAAAQSIFFVVEQDGYAQVREYYFDGDQREADAYNTTQHVPRYIPAGVTKLAASTAEDVLAVSTTGDPSRLYVYKWLASPEERVQSAWTRWTFPGATVLNADFIEADLYVVLVRDGATWLERLPLAPGKLDDGATFLTHLDRRVSSEDLPEGTYSSGQDTTTFTLPYSVGEDCVAVVRAEDGFNDIAAGVSLEIVDLVDDEIVVRGDHRFTPLWFGFRYASTAELSPIYLRQQKGQGGSSPIVDGSLKLTYATLLMGRTAYVRAEVTPVGRETYVNVHNGRRLNAPEAILGRPGDATGKFRFKIGTDASTARIVFCNDSHLPMHLLSVDWEGNFVLRSRRL